MKVYPKGAATADVTMPIDPKINVGSTIALYVSGRCTACNRKVVGRWRWLERLRRWWHAKRCACWFTIAVHHEWRHGEVCLTHAKLERARTPGILSRRRRVLDENNITALAVETFSHPRVTP